MVANPRILRGCKQKIASCESRFFYSNDRKQCCMVADGTMVAYQRPRRFFAGRMGEWIGGNALVRLAAPALINRSHEITNTQRERE
jgi:hypothetical protein